MRRSPSAYEVKRVADALDELLYEDETLHAKPEVLGETLAIKLGVGRIGYRRGVLHRVPPPWVRAQIARRLALYACDWPGCLTCRPAPTPDSQDLHALIQANPGLTTDRLALLAQGAGRATVARHLRELRRRRLVWSAPLPARGPLPRWGRPPLTWWPGRGPEQLALFPVRGGGR